MLDLPKLIILRCWLSSDLLHGVKRVNTVCFASAAKKWAVSGHSLQVPNKTNSDKKADLGSPSGDCSSVMTLL